MPTSICGHIFLYSIELFIDDGLVESSPQSSGLESIFVEDIGGVI